MVAAILTFHTDIMPPMTMAFWLGYSASSKVNYVSNFKTLNKYKCLRGYYVINNH